MAAQATKAATSGLLKVTINSFLDSLVDREDRPAGFLATKQYRIQYGNRLCKLPAI